MPKFYCLAAGDCRDEDPCLPAGRLPPAGKVSTGEVDRQAEPAASKERLLIKRNKRQQKPSHGCTYDSYGQAYPEPAEECDADILFFFKNP